MVYSTAVFNWTFILITFCNLTLSLAGKVIELYITSNFSCEGDDDWIKKRKKINKDTNYYYITLFLENNTINFIRQQFDNFIAVIAETLIR